MDLSAHTPHATPTPYQTLRPLARGGMGSVDIAVLKKAGFRRLFAIKRLRPELVEDERAKAMLLEEGRIAGQLQHPNIVPVVDVGEDAQGPYLVMDLVPGVALGDLVRWSRNAKQRLDVQLVLRLVRDAARGLHAAHELRDAEGRPLSLVHRDVSPQNVLVGFDGIARVTDFGIAKVLDRERETTHGLLKGKTGYMAPEQLRFESVDRRADLFALGVVLHELLAGERLYRGKDLPETARMILHAPPPDIGETRKDVPPEVVELLFELLAKDREARPTTAKEIETRIEAVINELAQRDGAFDVEGFLKSELADRFDETTQWSRLLEAPLTPEPTPTDPSPSRRTSPSTQATSSSARWTWALGAAALATAAALGWTFASRLAHDDVPSPVTATTPTERDDTQRVAEAERDDTERVAETEPTAAEIGPAATTDTPPATPTVTGPTTSTTTERPAVGRRRSRETPTRGEAPGRAPRATADGDEAPW